MAENEHDWQDEKVPVSLSIISCIADRIFFIRFALGVFLFLYRFLEIQFQNDPLTMYSKKMRWNDSDMDLCPIMAK
jgi:hypothetical protein